jgi:hypothetical protein
MSVCPGRNIKRTESESCSPKHRFSIVSVLVLAVLCAISSSVAVRAASLYPHSYLVQRHYIGAHVVPPADTDGVFFAVKRQPFWAGEGTVVSVWDWGTHLRRSITLADGAVLCAGRVSARSLVIVREQGTRVQLATIDTNLAIQRVTELPEQFLVPRTADCRLLTLATDRFLALLNGIVLYGQVTSVCSPNR